MKNVTGEAIDTATSFVRKMYPDALFPEPESDVIVERVDHDRFHVTGGMQYKDKSGKPQTKKLRIEVYRDVYGRWFSVGML